MSPRVNPREGYRIDWLCQCGARTYAIKDGPVQELVIAGHRNAVSYCEHGSPLVGADWQDLDTPMTPRMLDCFEGLDRLTDEERMFIFGKFCTSCGGRDPYCHCANDE